MDNVLYYHINSDYDQRHLIEILVINIVSIKFKYVS